MKKIPIGISDFKEIIEKQYYYIDKSLFIKDIMDFASKAILIPRPRRFGKTLNLSMLKYYFEKSDKDYSFLFKDLEIWQQEEEYTSNQGKYPVIFLTFKDVNSKDWQGCHEHLKGVISSEYERHSYLLKSEFLNDKNKKQFEMILNDTASKVDYENSLKNLSYYLSEYYNENVMILIDEYNTPVRQGFLNGYYDEVIEFIRNFLGGALKDNTSLEKGILTGLLSVANENTLVGFNNFTVSSILKEEFSTYFGLLENEVYDMLKYYGLEIRMDDIKKWYNGYIFGESVIYNPWSIFNFAQEHKYSLIPYWVNASSDSLVKNLIVSGGHRFKTDIENLIKGKIIEKEIDENIVFGDLKADSDSVWSFLLFTGYLKVVSKRFTRKGLLCTLKVPNLEVEFFYKETIIEWFKGSTTSEKMQEMLEALIKCDMVTFEYYFKQFVLNTMSYFDPTGKEPERVYQAFVLGILLNLDDNYQVKSNRESGLGRYDIALIPRDTKLNKNGMIFELKKANPATKETIEEALIAAENQIEEKKYEVEIIDAGVKKENIIKIAIAFTGKDTLIKWS